MSFARAPDPHRCAFLLGMLAVPRRTGFRGGPWRAYLRLGGERLELHPRDHRLIVGVGGCILFLEGDSAWEQAAPHARARLGHAAVDGGAASCC